MTKFLSFAIFLSTLLMACGNEPAKTEQQPTDPAADPLRYEQEKHLKNVKQLTFGGDNAEAYFSFDNKLLTLQVTNADWGTSCDQIFFMPVTGTNGQKPPMVSTGKGKTTCSYFMPGNQQILYASTHLAADTCLSTPRVVNGKYVWGIHKEFDIFVADLEGNIVKQLTNAPGYDAEATVSPDGTKIVFTSTRSGDLELWTMNIDGTDQKQVTKDLGYDGGAFFTPDSKQLVFRASRPTTPEAQATYKELLAQGLVQPTDLEIFVCNVDGSNMRQVTNLGGANWAPYMHPNGQKIVFATNHHSESGRQFNIFAINTDGTGLEQVTFDEGFDSFPMFSFDGKHLVFASNRNNGGTRDTNVFLAEWVD
jgi:TolB protein